MADSVEGGARRQAEAGPDAGRLLLDFVASGGIGGTHFTPIINAPEVAILGLSRGAMKPVWDGKQFVPRLTLPLSLSYDHRVIDGAEAARFNAYLSGDSGGFPSGDSLIAARLRRPLDLLRAGHRVSLNLHAYVASRTSTA